MVFLLPSTVTKIPLIIAELSEHLAGAHIDSLREGKAERFVMHHITICIVIILCMHQRLPTPVSISLAMEIDKLPVSIYHYGELRTIQSF